MASYELDKLVMLLSADWFLPHWQVVGICTEEKDRLLLKEGFREIVRQIMSDGEQYWETDFSPERVRRTRAMLEALLKRCKLEQAAVSRINRLISGQEFPIDGGTRWLLVSMTEQLLDCLAADVPPLDSAIKEALRKEWGRWQDLREADFKELCLTSTSSWDRYLRNTTSDLPAMLADYALAIASESKFEVLWGFINAKLTMTQKHELLSWYRSVGQSLTGEPLRLAQI